MTIIHAQSTVLVSGARVIYNVALGANQTQDSLAVATEASSGWRLKYNGGVDGPSQMAQSPDNIIVEGDWGQDRTIITPPGFNTELFEFKWDEVSQDVGFTSTTSPVAEATFTTWNGNEQWIGRRVGSIGSISWVINITLREINNITNTDVIQVTLIVEVSP